MPQYYEIVRELTTKAHLPMPRLYVSPAAQPNAFATGRNPKHAAVAVTQGILQICSWSELRGVLAHEISHVRNRDILTASVAASISLGITFVARMMAYVGFFLPMGGGGNRNDENVLGLLAMLIFAPLAATLLQLALSRSREYEADRDGARLLGDGEPLASALTKLEVASRQIPMQVPREVAALFIVNPLRRRSASPTGSATTRRPRSVSPVSVPGVGAPSLGSSGLRASGSQRCSGHSLKFSNWSGIPKSCSFKAAMVVCRSSRFLAVTRTCSPWAGRIRPWERCP